MIRTSVVVYLAHVGSYVPAESATIARTDAIHTRMHSKESAATNASAFMLDLSQMASIFRHSTSRSLCLIDEFGKGTNSQVAPCKRPATCRHSRYRSFNSFRSSPQP